MAGLLLYFPGRTQPIPSGRTDLIPRGFGLEAMLSGASWSRFQVVSGPDGTPDGQNGQLLALAPGLEGTQARSEFDKDAQQWLEVKSPDGSMWFGWRKAEPPTPADLEREELLDGWPVKLGDGSDWVVPVTEPRLTTLPLSFHKDEDGKFVGVPMQRYESLIEETAKWFELIQGDHTKVFDDVVNYCTRLLQLNYRVHVDLMSQAGLELLDDRSASAMIDVAVGIRTINERETQSKDNPGT